MGFGREDRKPGGLERLLRCSGLPLVCFALGRRVLQVANGRTGCGGNWLEGVPS